MLRKLPLLFYLLISYMLLAFSWWAFLLYRTTDELHEAKLDRLGYEMAIQGRVRTPADFLNTELYREEASRYDRQQRMVLYEAILLVLTLMGAVYFLYNSLRKQISASEQQRNFLLSITHELKSPLSGIRLILETFQKRRELPAAMQEKLSTNALAETDRLTALVNDLLLSAKLENVYDINPEQIDLAEIIQEAADRVAMKYRTAKVHVDIEPGLPTVLGDRLGLTSLAVNLLENAAKYSQPDPEIHTSLQRGGGSELVWEVADNGIGIPDSEKRKVFNKFYRVGSEDTRTTKGTGLGLFIVKGLVEKHGGLLELSDNKPQGTKFRVHLPVAEG